MRIVFFLCLTLFFDISVKAQKDTITTRIVLIGDAGQLTNGHHPVVDAVRNLILLNDRTSILYLGDNLYKKGLPDEEYKYYAEAHSVLDTQLAIADNTPARIFMIPGNHDWENGKPSGYRTVMREQAYVNSVGKNVKFYPENGCPGPVEVDLSDDVTLVIFDTQWWLHPYDKPGIESDCDCKTTDEVLTRLDDIFSRNAKKLIILAGHHTFKSSGVHGGYFKLKQHIFPFTDINKKMYIPLPVIGSIYPIARSVFGTPQDLKHPTYADMITSVEKIAKKYPHVLFVAGHEHSLQLIKDSSSNYIVSGGGSKHNRVSTNKRTPFATTTNGFAVLEISTNKNVRVTYYTVDDSVKMAYTEVIQNFSKLPRPVADSTNRKLTNSAVIKYKDTITISGSDQYDSATWAKRIMVGTNYRKEWSTPVTMKVFNIHTEKGGLKIVSLGGGKQTKSLTLKDPSGREWKLRTIDKNPANAIPEAFRNTVASEVVQDFISASHPYGPLTIPPMEEALGLVAAKPELFFVPDDPAFGFYQPMFANTVCTLEEKDTSRYGEDTKSTEKAFDKLIEENDHRVDQETVLRARLLDILIADFDRHFDQWKWGTIDTGKAKLYYPIPKDRDQAYFRSNGVILSLAAQRALPMLKGFQRNFPKIDWLSWSARDFDRLFLTDLDKKDWENEVQNLQRKLDDSVLIQSIRRLPPAIYRMDSAALIDRLVTRRDHLLKPALRYYRFLSKRVNVLGSNQKEYFKVTGEGKDVRVIVYARKKKSDSSFVMYDRTFDPRVTKDIRLYGLNDDDKFEIDSTVRSKIRVSMIGGKGTDTFDVKGHAVNYLYDLKTEKNVIEHRNRTRDLSSNEPPVNYYNILGFNYNVNRFPRVNLGYNAEDGVFAGLGFSRRTYGFRNLPYATDQRLSTLYAINRGAYAIKYNGEFNHFFRNFDALVNIDYQNPVLNNFFGFGNNTTIDPQKGISYYRVRYNYAEGQLFFRRRLFDKLHILIGPDVYRYWNDQKDNAGKILSAPSLAGLDSASVYNPKIYVGGKLAVVFNNLNNELFPTRGVQWKTEFTSLAGASENSHSYTSLTSDMSVYASISEEANLVMVARIGGGHIFSKNYEYFQALNLGANNFLRGFRKTRFSGTSVAYNSMEARIKLVDVKSYVCPGVLGLVLFNDVGRVWVPNETSRRWHDAYGGGFYFIPFKMIIVSATVGFSGEERIFNFSAGTKINLTF